MQPISLRPSPSWIKRPAGAASETSDCYQHVTVDDIAAKAQLPFRAPWAVAGEARQWAREHPAQEGRQDRLVLEVQGGPHGTTELLRNGSSEFSAPGSQGSHDCDHVMYQSFFEQVGGRPLLSASPLNEVTVNCFEWELEPHWRSQREAEMAPMGIDPTAPDAFPRLEIGQALRGAARTVHNTILEQSWTGGLFQATGRDPESFPNQTELDLSLRAITGSWQPLASITDQLTRYTVLGTELARRVGEAFPAQVAEANRWSDQVEQVKNLPGAEAHVECLPLPCDEAFLAEVRPLVAEMNEILDRLPAPYVHGFASPVGYQAPLLQLEG